MYEASDAPFPGLAVDEQGLTTFPSAATARLARVRPTPE